MVSSASTRDRHAASEAGLSNAVPDAMRLYLDSVSQYPLLSAADEIELAVRIGYADLARAALSSAPEPIGAQREALLGYVAAGADARMTMIASNLRLVLAIAGRFQHTQVPILDLVQEGTIGLIRAVEKFDPRIGARFGTMARFWIRQTILRLLSERSRVIARSGHFDTRCRRVRRLREELEQSLGRRLAIAELAAASGLTVQQLSEVERTTLDPVSLDRPPAASQEPEIQIVDTGSSPEAAVLARERSEAVQNALAMLDPRTREILAWRYGYMDDRAHKLADIGRRYRLSRERIRQIVNDGEAILRAELYAQLGDSNDR